MISPIMATPPPVNPTLQEVHAAVLMFARATGRWQNKNPANALNSSAFGPHLDPDAFFQKMISLLAARYEREEQWRNQATLAYILCRIDIVLKEYKLSGPPPNAGWNQTLISAATYACIDDVNRNATTEWADCALQATVREPLKSNQHIGAAEFLLNAATKAVKELVLGTSMKVDDNVLELARMLRQSHPVQGSSPEPTGSSATPRGALKSEQDVDLMMDDVVPPSIITTIRLLLASHGFDDDTQGEIEAAVRGVLVSKSGK